MVKFNFNENIMLNFDWDSNPRPLGYEARAQRFVSELLRQTRVQNKTSMFRELVLWDDTWYLDPGYSLNRY